MSQKFSHNRKNIFSGISITTTTKIIINTKIFETSLITVPCLTSNIIIFQAFSFFLIGVYIGLIIVIVLGGMVLKWGATRGNYAASGDSSSKPV